MIFRILLSFVLVFPAYAQLLEVAPDSEVQARLKAAKESLEAWRAADPALEKDILSRPPGEILPRVKAAAAKSKIAGQDQLRLSETVLKQFEASLEWLEEAAGAGGHVDEVRIAAKSRLSHLNELEDNLRALADEDSGLKPEQQMLRQANIRKELKHVSVIRKNLEQQVALASKAQDFASAIQSSYPELLKNYKEIVDLANTDVERIKKENEKWELYYAALEDRTKHRLDSEQAAVRDAREKEKERDRDKEKEN